LLPKTLTFCLLLILLSEANAKEDTLKYCISRKVTATGFHLDGKAEEAMWHEAAVCNHFVQYRPVERARPSQPTEFRVVYDEEFLYFFIRAYDSSPDSILKRLSRRDEGEGDQVGIQIDSYNDKLTAFYFLVNAAGVKYDALVSDQSDGEPDKTWDAVWDAKTAVDAKGWAAEFKIPLSALRFEKKEMNGWGLQVSRYIYRNDETSLWQFIPRDAAGWVRHFGRLEGIYGLSPSPQAEIMPYVAARTETYAAEAGNPYRTGSASGLAAGLDGKVSLTNNLILDYTINPDFGQVEADPSEVNLTAFETYFEEKRPFFMEGRNILSFKLTPGDGGSSADNLFYSRRIGRRPHHYPDADYADVPGTTPILGALKLTGKTARGWSVGLLEGMTAETMARKTEQEQESTEVVEPFTNYLIARIQKDFDKGATRFGAMATSTLRHLPDNNNLQLPQSAHTAGIDFVHSWKNRTYYLNIKGIFSSLAGSATAIENLQKSHLRYFQRPDAGYVHLDPTRTRLNGHGGLVNFGKEGDGRWNYTTWISWRSPGLELNDAGYLRMADDIFQVFWVGYRYYEPIGIFRNLNINFNQWSGWDFGGSSRYKGGNINAWTQFKNYWQAGMGINYNGEERDNHILRGGPSIKLPGGISIWANLHSDTRKKLVASLSARWYKTPAHYMNYRNIRLRVVYKPTDALSFSLSPVFSFNDNQLQYITTAETANDTRYILGSISQRTFATEFRANLCITPELTVQYYGQPFISAGQYKAFKYITSPGAERFTDRFRIIPDQALRYNDSDEMYMVDENLDGQSDYTFGKPDYNALFFLSNLVIRWEYTTGSAIYLVWSQNRSDFDNTGKFRFEDDMSSLFEVYPHNIFMVKFSYRIQYHHLNRIF